MWVKRAWMSNALRMRIFERDWFKCYYCWAIKDDWVVLHVDHIIPVSKWWTNDEINLVCSCSKCNHWKHARILNITQGIIEYSLDKEVNIVDDALKKKEETKQKVKEYTLKKNELNRDFELEWFIEWMLEYGVEIPIEERKWFSSLIKKYWIELVLEACMLATDDKKNLSRYIDWVIQNLFIKKEFEIWYENWYKIQKEIIYPLKLKFPLSKKQVLDICQCLNNEFLEELPITFEEIKLIVDLYKSHKNYRIINQVVFEMCSIINFDIKDFISDYILNLVSAYNNISPEIVITAWEKWRAVRMSKELFNKKRLDIVEWNLLEKEWNFYLYINFYG